MSDTESSDVEDLMYLLDEIDSDMEIQGNILVKGVDKPHVVIPEGVEIIGPDAFQLCTSLTSVVLPEGLTSIGKRAFYYCTGLTSVDLSATNLTSIGDCAFYECSGLTSVEFPSTLTSIEYGAFKGCTGLTSVVLPAGLTSIGKRTFTSCTGLTSVTLPEGLTSIKYEAFKYCKSLTGVVLPSTLTSIEAVAFKGCTRLAGVTLPEGLTSLKWSVFAHCRKLTSVVLPSTLTSIGNEAFFDCTRLTSLTLPGGLTSIGEYAFHGCTRLRVLVPPCQVDPKAFIGCRLVINTSGSNIPGSVVLNPRIIGLRQRLLAIWSATVRRQGRLRQSSRGYRAKNLGASQGFVELYSREELLEVVRVWREIKQILAGVTRRGEVVEFLFAKIIEGGRKLITMKSYLNQPEETKVFKKVLEDLGIEEPFTESGGEEKEIHVAKRMKRLRF